MARFYAIEIKAQGSLTVEIGEDEPKSVVQLTLEQIVADYAKARDEELKRQGQPVSAEN